MTTSLALSWWMVMELCLEHYQETPEKSYTNLQLIYPRNTVNKKKLVKVPFWKKIMRIVYIFTNLFTNSLLFVHWSPFCLWFETWCCNLLLQKQPLHAISIIFYVQGEEVSQLYVLPVYVWRSVTTMWEKWLKLLYSCSYPTTNQTLLVWCWLDPQISKQNSVSLTCLIL